MRPRALDEVVGQRHVLGPGRPLREMLERRRVGSMILWGPPGSGKTTIARLIAAHTDRAFVPFSAVTEGVPRVREIVGEAAERWRAEGRGTILFVDEIHRFNRGQQDAFLPHVETGTVTLVGATTENPSFELVGALLSRARVFVLEALGAPDLRRSSARARRRRARPRRARPARRRRRGRAARRARRRRRPPRAHGARGGRRPGGRRAAA
jgi:putative ATPase